MNFIREIIENIKHKRTMEEMALKKYTSYDEMCEDLIEMHKKHEIFNCDYEEIKKYFENIVNNDITKMNITQLEERYSDVPAMPMAMYHQILSTDLCNLFIADCEEAFRHSILLNMEMVERVWQLSKQDRDTLIFYQAPEFRELYNEYQHQN